jgi:hypothetical protein
MREAGRDSAGRPCAPGSGGHLDMPALGVIIPVLPKLVESFVGGDTARASEFLGLFGTA